MGIDRTRYLTAEVAGDTYLLDEHTGAAFRLGGSGPRLWQLLDAGATLDEAARAIADESRADPGRVGADVRLFARRLSELGVELDAG